MARPAFAAVPDRVPREGLFKVDRDAILQGNSGGLDPAHVQRKLRRRKLNRTNQPLPESGMAFVIVANRGTELRGLGYDAATPALAALADMELEGYAIQHLFGHDEAPLDRGDLAHFVLQEMRQESFQASAGSCPRRDADPAEQPQAAA